MKKNILYTILSGFAAFVCVSEAVAQPQINRSAYFLEGATYRHELNPAFMGERGYVGFPGLGNLSVGAQGTAGVGDFLFVKPNGDLMTFMHGDVSRQDFLNGLPNRIKLGFILLSNKS